MMTMAMVAKEVANSVDGWVDDDDNDDGGGGDDDGGDGGG